MIPSCCILNGGNGGWAFESLARQLSAALWVDISPVVKDFNYLLYAEESDLPPEESLFISYRAMQTAADKRLLAEWFLKAGVPTPETILLDTRQEVLSFVQGREDREWCLKYPLGCGASGHRLIQGELMLPRDWPKPFIVQEFIRLERPEVYRTYAAGGELFGWIARRFPEGSRASPWVAHARGARYERVGKAPEEALHAAQLALSATDLLETFGCVDLLRKATGQWVVLEVGTDGMFNHVDREVGDSDLEVEIQRRIAETFWRRLGEPPWGRGSWRAKVDETTGMS